MATFSGQQPTSQPLPVSQPSNGQQSAAQSPSGQQQPRRWTWPAWTGFGNYISPPHLEHTDFQRSKTLWDWFQLLIIPVLLAAGALWFNVQQSQMSQQLSDRQHQHDVQLSQQQHQTDLQIAADQQRETTLKTTMDDIKDLLFNRNLIASKKPKDEVRVVARAEVLSALRQLDGKRKGILIQFLYEANLISVPPTHLVTSSGNDVIIDLSGANLHDADLGGADLRGVNLFYADLRGVHLRGADLSGADLHDADLSGANLNGANLNGANLSSVHLGRADLHYALLNGTLLNSADLSGANLSYADLSGADLHYALLNGALLNSADLSCANLSGANLNGATGTTTEQLKKAKSLHGTIMPDGSKHP